jgi:hypothetical protein
MTQVDLGLTSVGRFDSADSVISVNDANKTWGVTVLHLHQQQSSRNLHLHYLAKNQSTQCCQSLITPGSDHPPVLEPHMVLNLPLDDCIDNIHIK